MAIEAMFFTTRTLAVINSAIIEHTTAILVLGFLKVHLPVSNV